MSQYLEPWWGAIANNVIYSFDFVETRNHVCASLLQHAALNSS